MRKNWAIVLYFRYLDLQEKEKELEEMNLKLHRKIGTMTAEVKKMRVMYMHMREAGLIPA